MAASAGDGLNVWRPWVTQVEKSSWWLGAGGRTYGFACLGVYEMIQDRTYNKRDVGRRESVKAIRRSEEV